MITDKKIQDMKDKMRSIQDERAATEKEEQALHKEKWDELRPFEVEMDKISKKFVPRENEIRSKANRLEEEEQKVRIDLWEAETKQKMEQIIVSGKHTDASIYNFVRLHRIAHDVVVTEKKTLPNGVQIFKIDCDRDYNMWMAFKNLDFIGLSFRRQGRHPGDQTTPHSFIGDLDKRIKVDQKSHWDDTVSKVNATFTQWSDKLKAMTDAQLKKNVVDLSDREIECIREKKSGGESWTW